MAGLYDARPIFEGEHESFRASVKAFLSREVVDHIEDWEAAEQVPRDVWKKAGANDLVGLLVPEELGGSGSTDHRFRMVMGEEFAKVGAASFAAGLDCHIDIVLPYFVHLCTPEQGKRWIPQLASGEHIGAIAMTEPGTGSDLRGIRTTARRDGHGWILNGSKIFITNGINADVVIVVARTSADPSAGSGSFSLFVVEDGTPGFARGRRLNKVGLKGQDTAELSFDEVRLTDEHLLGEEGGGLAALMEHLPLERMSIAITACAGTRAALQWTIDYVQERTAFGKRIAEFQNTQFAVAEMLTELEITQAYVDAAVTKLNAGALSAVDAAKAKWWATEMQKRTVDRCVQLHGGYGYMLEYPIARAFIDSRVTTIYGGTTEIMKVIIARDALAVR